MVRWLRQATGRKDDGVVNVKQWEAREAYRKDLEVRDPECAKVFAIVCPPRSRPEEKHDGFRCEWVNADVDAKPCGKKGVQLLEHTDGKHSVLCFEHRVSPLENKTRAL